MHALSKDTAVVCPPYRSGHMALGGGFCISHGNKTTISGREQAYQDGRMPVMPTGRVPEEFAGPMGGQPPPRQSSDRQPMNTAWAQRRAESSSKRAGPGDPNGYGAIARSSAVLVERAVHNEPVDHGVRGILDHYIVQERNIAERRHFPLSKKSKSVFRPVPGCNTPQEQSLARRSQVPRAGCEVPAEFIRFGARKAGTNGELDTAIELHPHPQVLQTKDEGAAFTECYAVLEKIMGSTPGKGDGS